MSVKSKKMRKIARNAAMSALIVSAIVGTGVVASAASSDNVSRISSGTVNASSSFSGVAAGLEVTGGTLYVDVDTTTKNNGGVNIGGVGTSTNAWIKGGSVIVGLKAPGAGVVQPGAGDVTLTVDNMTIDGGTVSVTNNSTLAANRDININGGALKLSGTTDSEGKPVANSGSTVTAANVNINAGGTLEASGGLQNVVNASGAVNLRGGTIVVAEKGGAALTLGTEYGGAATAGNLYVASGKTLNSYGGSIKAGLVSEGATNFKGGTTTVDNLTVAGGTTIIEGNATVNVLQDKAHIAKGELEMKGGTLRVAEGKGTLKVGNAAEGFTGTLKASAGINTVDANVKVDATGEVQVSGAATLTITKNFEIVSGGEVGVGGTTANLILQGGLKAAAGAIQVGHPSDSGVTGTLTIGHKALVSTDVASNAIKIGDGSTGKVDTGTVIVKDYGKTLVIGSGADTDITGKIEGGKLVGDYSQNNIVIWGQQLQDANGKIVEAKFGESSTTMTAGVNVVVEVAALKSGQKITAPSVSVTGGALSVVGGSSVELLGVGMGDASNKTSTLEDLKVGGVVTATNGAGLVAKKLEMVVGGELAVLNTTANIGNLKSSGGTIFVDPAYVTINGIEGKLGAQVLTGSGSVVAIGSNNTEWLKKPMTDAGFVFGNTNQAVLGVAVADTIAVDTAGVVVVDPTAVKDDTNSKFYLSYGATPTKVEITQANVGAFWAGAGSLTVIDAANLNGKPVFDLSDATTKVANIADGAKLHVANLTVKGLTIFTGATAIGKADGTNANNYASNSATAGWAGANLIQPDRMLKNVGMSNTGVLTAEAASASDALGMSHEFNGLMAGVWDNALNNTNSANAGIRFVSRAASKDFGLTAEQAAKAIEGAAQLGAVAGVQGVTISAANSATSAVATRTSFAQPLLDKSKAVAMNMGADGSVSLDSGLSAGNGMKNGLGLWIMPLYQSNRVWGQDAGNFKSGYNSDLGGIAAGVDYTVNDMFRFGAALNIGAGYSKSDGDFAETDNSFNFWGVNLYGGWTMNNFGLSADVGYTGNYNKVEQDAPAALGMSKFKSDINSSAWTAGLKAEYKIETSVMDIIPHLGVRYMGLTTGEYDVKSNGTAFKVDEDFQSIWTFPIGVTMSKNIEMNSGWVFKPQLDLSVIPAAGDVEAKSKSRIPGAPGSAEAKMQVVDYVTFDGGLGFDIGNENLTFGLNYNIQASEHRTGHGVFGTVRYEF